MDWIISASWYKVVELFEFVENAMFLVTFVVGDEVVGCIGKAVMDGGIPELEEYEFGIDASECMDE